MKPRSFVMAPEYFQALSAEGKPQLAPEGYRINQPHRIPINISVAFNRGATQLSYMYDGTKYVVTIGLAKSLMNGSTMVRAIIVKAFEPDGTPTNDGYIMEGSPLPGGIGYGARGIHRLTSNAEKPLSKRQDICLRILAGLYNSLSDLCIISGTAVDIKRLMSFLSRNDLRLLFNAFRADPLHGFAHLMRHLLDQKVPMLRKVSDSQLMEALKGGLYGETYISGMSALGTHPKYRFPKSFPLQKGDFDKAAQGFPFEGSMSYKESDTWNFTEKPPINDAVARLLMISQIASGTGHPPDWIGVLRAQEPAFLGSTYGAVPLGSKGSYYLLSFLDEDGELSFDGLLESLDLPDDSGEDNLGLGQGGTSVKPK